MDNTLQFEAFANSHGDLTTLIGNSGEEGSTMYGVLKNSDLRMKAALQDGERGNWAASKIDAWNTAYNNLMPKMARLVQLMSAAGTANESYQQWVAQQQNTNYYN